jgi:tripartite-type tricarboxylate transporter receptor subunit TctC
MNPTSWFLALLRALRSVQLAIAVVACGFHAAQAQGNYPSRPIRIVTPFAAGAVSDISLRIVAEKLAARLDTGVIVENQTGAGGIAAARQVISAAPDGHTLALLSNATAVSVGLFKNLTFDPRSDFTPIVGISDFAYIFVTNSAAAYRSLQDVIAAARAKPGQLNVGTANAGTSNHLTALLFKATLGLDFVVVPYRGPSELTVALYRNDLDLVVNAYGGLRPAIEDGKIKVLAVTSGARSPLLPDVPTAQELGIKGFEVSSWNGLYGPAGTPLEVVERIAHEVRQILAEPDVQKRFADLGLEVRPSPAPELDKRMRAEIERWSKVIDEAGIDKR